MGLAEIGTLAPYLYASAGPVDSLRKKNETFYTLWGYGDKVVPAIKIDSFALMD